MDLGGPAGSAGEDGCTFPLAAAAGEVKFCGHQRRPGSPYCAEHHSRCHVAPGSRAESARLRQIEALAEAVGGRQGRRVPDPPQSLLRRLDRIDRGFLRPKSSCFVRDQ